MKTNIEISPNIETLFGTRDENLRLLENGLKVTIGMRTDSIEIEGDPSDVARTGQVFADYQHLLRNGFTFVNGDLGAMLKVLTADSTATLRGLAEAGKQRSFGKRTVQPKSINQRRYLEAIEGGQFARLPGGIYNISYIRQYARAIEINEGELLARYLQSASVS